MLHQAVDETQLPDYGRRENEWIHVAKSYRSAEAVHCENERKPGACDGVELSGRVGIEIYLRGQSTDPVCSWRDAHAEIRGHFKRVHDMEVMSPCLRKVLPGMGGGIGRNITFLPVYGRSLRIVALESIAVVHRVVAEYHPASLQLSAIVHQQVPIMMTHFMSEVRQ